MENDLKVTKSNDWTVLRGCNTHVLFPGARGNTFDTTAVPSYCHVLITTQRKEHHESFREG